MKVLYVFFGKDYFGGTTYSTFTLAQNLVARGHEVHAYVRPTPAGTLKRDLEACSVIVHDGNAPTLVHPKDEKRMVHRIGQFVDGELRRFFSYPKSEREIERIVRECDIDLVVLSGGPILSGIRAARRTGRPFVWHIREFMQEDHGYKYFHWVHPYDHMLDAQCLVCVSQAVEDKMRRVCPGAHTEYVYNGIDQKVFHNEGRVERAAGDPVRIMTSSGVRHSKGTFLMLDALAQVPQDLSFVFDIYGGTGAAVGESEADLQAYVERLGLGDRVSYHGPVSNIADEYRRHDIQIVASRQEAFGRVTAESMFCGCAVVGSNSGGTPELIADGRGYLFEPNDADSLARAITEAASDDAERSARAARASAYARENFSVNAYVDKIEAIYRMAVA